MASCTACLVLFVALLSALSVPSAYASLLDEAQALIVFKKGITRDPFGRLASWSDDHNASSAPEPCGSLLNHHAAWVGIRCDAQQLHVVNVSLRSFNLSGSISSSLAMLPWLSLLDLSDNQFSGHIPTSLLDGGQLAGSLQYLNLSFNSLGGNLPEAQLGNLSSLTLLDLSHNSFMGSLPASFWQLPRLQILRLESPGANPLPASLPETAFRFCPTIKELRLTNLVLSGQLPPSLGQCKQLQILVLRENGLQGVIPQGIWQLPALSVLHLVETVYDEGLHIEPVPDVLGFCPTITELWLQGFGISTAGSTTRISPAASLGDCKQLEVLFLDLGGDLPSGFHVTPGIWQLPQLSVLRWIDSQTVTVIDNAYEGLNRPFKLSGSMPDTFGFCSTITFLQIDGINLTGEIPPSLGSCTGLWFLDLSHSSIQGAIPAALQNLTGLQALFLESNLLTGGIPAWISHLSQLEQLGLGDNPLGGRIPPEIGQLEQLLVLSLFTANLSGPVPEELGNCTQLEWLDLGSSPIYLNEVGKFPNSLARLTNLQTLAWSGDTNCSTSYLMHLIGNFSMLDYIQAPSIGVFGGITPQLGNLLQQLSKLDLSSNDLTGSIPSQLIGNLSRLQRLNLANNHLKGPLPHVRFSKLQYLNLGGNMLSGSIPDQFLANSSIGELYLYNNELQGVIPSSIGGLQNLAILYMNNNYLEGEIPVTLGNCSALNDISLANNRLEGQIPHTLGQLLALSQNLLLSNNSFTGDIPHELGNLVHLTILDVSRNSLVGQIPKTLENCTSLQILRLFENSLAGDLVQLDLSKMESLQRFSVQQNHLVGGLPAFTNSRSLVLLDVGNNSFSGAFPTSDLHALGLSKLRVLVMSYNRIRDNIPGWVWDLRNLQLLDLSNNLLTGSMPHTLSHLQYLKSKGSTKIDSSLTLYEEVPIILKNTPQVFTYVLNSRVLFDVSMNSLEGNISESFGELIGLTSLNLSHNRITGNIPPALGNLTQLESLDVSYNNLTGSIPERLGTLSSLASFDVSNNQLQGQIPTLDNFDTRFNSSSFEGNPGLCGFPLPTQCNTAPVGAGHGTAPTLGTSASSKIKHWIRNSVSLEGFFIGYPIGLLGGLCVAWLAFNSNRMYTCICLH